MLIIFNKDFFKEIEIFLIFMLIRQPIKPYTMEYTKADFEPTVGDAYNHGWKTIWKYFLELFLVGLLLFIISIPVNAFSFLIREDGNWFGIGIFVVFSAAYGILILGPLQYGMYYCYLKAVRRENLQVGDLF